MNAASISVADNENRDEGEMEAQAADDVEEAEAGGARFFLSMAGLILEREDEGRGGGRFVEDFSDPLDDDDEEPRAASTIGRIVGYKVSIVKKGIRAS